MGGVVEEWLDGGKTAVMMITSTLQYPDATDEAYPKETAMLLSGMTPTEMAIAMTWLARVAGQAMLDKHDGCHETVEAELQEMAVLVEEARASVIEGENWAN